ncbi:MAG: hypothetical protein WCS17_11985 [Prevotella sp.]
MKYIVASIEKARGNITCNIDARRQDSNGRVLLNEIDLKRLDGTLEERAKQIGGTILNESEALELINTKEWRGSNE